MKPAFGLLLLLCASACQVAQVAPGPDALSGQLADLADQARALEREGSLVDARFVWRAVDTIAPTATTRAELVRLDTQIADRIEHLIATARRHRESGAARRERQALLGVLAIDASHAEARDRLTQLTTTDMLASQRRKDDERYAVIVQRQSNQVSDALLGQLEAAMGRKDYHAVLRFYEQRPSDAQIPVGYAKDANLNLAASSLGAGDLEAGIGYYRAALALVPDDPRVIRALSSASERLADRYAAQGIAKLRTDLDGAVDLFQRALAADPEHAVATAQLERARVMQERLSEIRNAGGQG